MHSYIYINHNNRKFSDVNRIIPDQTDQDLHCLQDVFYKLEALLTQVKPPCSYLSLVVRKPVLGVSDQVQHKLGCTVTEDG